MSVFGILFARVGPIFTKKSLNKLTIWFPLVIVLPLWINLLFTFISLLRLINCFITDPVLCRLPLYFINISWKCFFSALLRIDFNFALYFRYSISVLAVRYFLAFLYNLFYGWLIFLKHLKAKGFYHHIFFNNIFLETSIINWLICLRKFGICLLSIISVHNMIPVTSI